MDAAGLLMLLGMASLSCEVGIHTDTITGVVVFMGLWFTGAGFVERIKN